MAGDLLESLLSLEDKYYQEGYDLGVADGQRAGIIEGRAFGLEKGFEKYLIMGKLHGKSLVLAGRLPTTHGQHQTGHTFGTHKTGNGEEQFAPLVPEGSGIDHITGVDPVLKAESSTKLLSLLPNNERLVRHIRTLDALVEPSSLSKANTEDSVSDFDDRLRRAEGKVKIIERMTGERILDVDAATTSNRNNEAPSQRAEGQAGDGSIEDLSILKTRH